MRNPRWGWHATMFEPGTNHIVGSFEVVTARPTTDAKALAETQVPAQWRGKVDLEVNWSAA